jgi:hypothetical protein
MKCGTNTAGVLLAKHPRVKINYCDNWQFKLCNETAFQGDMRSGDIWEGHDFSFIRETRPNWLQVFAQRLPWTDGRTSISIDKSPSYISTENFPDIASRMHMYLPKAKIVVSVCNPSLRLFSEYNHQIERTKNNFFHHFSMFNVTPPKSFGEFIDMVHTKCKDHHNDYCEHHRTMWVSKGAYAARLKPWIEAYGKDNVAVVHMEESESDTVDRLLTLVGEDILPPDEYPWDELKKNGTIIDFKNPSYAGRLSAYRDWPKEIEILDHFYQSVNEELAKVFDVEYPFQWIEQGHKFRNITH